MNLKNFNDFSINESKKKITKKLLKNLWDLHFEKFMKKAEELVEDGDIDEDELNDFLDSINLSKPKYKKPSREQEPPKYIGGCGSDDSDGGCGYSSNGGGCGYTSKKKSSGGCGSDDSDGGCGSSSRGGC